MAAALISRFGGWTAVGSKRNQVREMSELVKLNLNGKQGFIADALGMARRLEGQGIPSNQAEVISSAIAEVLNDGLKNASSSLVSNEEMKMSEVVQDSKLSELKSDVQNLQDHHYSLIQSENEMIMVEIAKIRGDLRSGIEKIRADQRIEMNLESERYYEELTMRCTETNTHAEKLQLEIGGLRAELEAAKFDVFRKGGTWANKSSNVYWTIFCNIFTTQPDRPPSSIIDLFFVM